MEGLLSFHQAWPPASLSAAVLAKTPKTPPHFAFADPKGFPHALDAFQGRYVGFEPVGHLAVLASTSCRPARLSARRAGVGLVAVDTVDPNGAYRETRAFLMSRCRKFLSAYRTINVNDEKLRRHCLPMTVRSIRRQGRRQGFRPADCGSPEAVKYFKAHHSKLRRA